MHTATPWVRNVGQTKKGPWGKTGSEGHGIRVVQPKVDRTNNKTPSLTVVGITWQWSPVLSVELDAPYETKQKDVNRFTYTQYRI